MAERRPATWRTYAKAARNTARRQAPDVGRAFQERRRDARRTAAATAVVAERRIREAGIWERLRAVVRDSALIIGSILVLWFIVTRTGAPIPLTAVLAVIGIILVVRVGYALIGSR